MRSRLRSKWVLNYLAVLAILIAVECATEKVGGEPVSSVN